MFRTSRSRRAAAVAVLAFATAASAGAATRHAAAITNGNGSLGSTTFLQSSASGGALQGEVATSPNTHIAVPFGVLGEYDPSGTTFGAGVIGISTTGYAVAGEALGTQPSVLGYAGGTGYGVEAVSASFMPALYAEDTGSGDGSDSYADGQGDGVNAVARGGGIGVQGVSNANGAGVAGVGLGTGYGVQGLSVSSVAVEGENQNGHAAVAGIQNDPGTGVGMSAQQNQTSATPGPTANPSQYAGLYAQSNEGPAVYGVNLRATGTAIAEKNGTFSQNYAGVFGFANDGPGLWGHSNRGIGAYVQNGGQADASGANYETLYLENVNGSAAKGIDLYILNDNTGEFSVINSAGNFFTSGTITAGTSSMAVTRNPNSDVTTYAAQSAEATVEDTGSAQLRDGLANVPLAADFRQTINGAMSYAVFLTPGGDCNGLFVAQKTPAGFVVRELRGGRSTLAFDYRIVARPYGTPAARLPHLASFVQRPALRTANVRNANLPQSNGAQTIDTPAVGALRAFRARAAAHAAPATLPPPPLRR